MMKHFSVLLLCTALLPTSSAGQEDVIDRLQEVLPPDVSAQVLERIADARARELPVQAMATLALEGVAKGRTAEEVLTAVEALAGDMGRAQDALQAGDHVPAEGDVEAATAAMRMGVDGDAVSELARSQPSGRTLAVPLLVLGGLVERDLSSDEALAAVLARLASGSTDAEILQGFPDVAQALGQSMPPAELGTALAAGFAGSQLPVSGLTVPVSGQDAAARGRRPGG